MMRAAFTSAIAMVVSVMTGWADSPGMIHYQGRLTLGTNLYSGPVDITFRMYDAPTGGTLLHASTNAATATDGLYATVIGEYVLSGDLDAALTNAQVWLEVEVNGSTLSPRERVLSVPYAHQTHGLRVISGNNIVLNPVAGGNTIDGSASHSAIGGGFNNNIGLNASLSAIAGGLFNDIFAGASRSFIGGGHDNNIGTNASYSVIAGGLFNDIFAGTTHSFIGGGENNNIVTNANHSAIAGGLNNDVLAGAYLSFIGGGQDNNMGVNAFYGAIAGGRFNDIFTGAYSSFIGGGEHINIGANATHSAIAGGLFNDIFAGASRSFIGGGDDNNIGTNASLSAIAGGAGNDIFAGATSSFIGGGDNNNIGANAPYSVIPGGRANGVGPNATNAFAAGRQALANHRGAFVWGDDTATDVTSSANNQVTFRASGGFRIFSNAGMTTGVVLAAGSGAWTSISDVNAKEGFASVDTREVLEKVAAMPITTWRYKGQDAAIRHMGPTAQDFAAAFGLGDLPGAGITTVDADGVLFAAVQALARENEALRRDNIELRKRLEALEERMTGF